MFESITADRMQLLASLASDFAKRRTLYGLERQLIIEQLYGLVQAPVDSSTVIAVGDFVYLNTDDARPASMLSDAGSKSANQIVFHDSFLGIALTASANGQTEPIWVSCRGRHTVNVDSADYMVGDLLGLDEQSNGMQLENQNLVKVSSTGQAVGRCCTAGNALTEVEVEIYSTVLQGGPMPG